MMAGVCEDNGPGSSLTDNCPFGTDCADCGPRFVAPPPSPPPPSPVRPPPSPSLPPYLCSNTCGWSDDNGNFYNMANNGACNDGGPGAEYSHCAIGTDCADCYFRFESGLVGLYGDQNPVNCVGGQYNKCPPAGTKLKPLGSVSTTGSGGTSGSSSSSTSGSSSSATSPFSSSTTASPPSMSTLCYNDCTMYGVSHAGNSICEDGAQLSSACPMRSLGRRCFTHVHSQVLSPCSSYLCFFAFPRILFSSRSDRWPRFRVYDGLPLWT